MALDSNSVLESIDNSRSHILNLESQPVISNDPISGVLENLNADVSTPKPVDAKPANQEPTKSWASLFTDNRKIGSGMNLSFVAPESNDVVTFDEDEWNEGNSLWKFSLIGQVLGLNVKFKAMENFIHKAWAKWNAPDICILKSGIFLFSFKNEVDMNDILVNGPWFFGSRPLLLKTWTNEEDIEKINDSVYPIKIASLIGKPIATDMLTAQRKRLAYARVLVEVHMPSPLPDQISIHGLNGKMIKQKVIYELKPKWCNSCRLIGHETMFCRRFPMTQRWMPKKDLTGNQSGLDGVLGSKNINGGNTVQNEVNGQDNTPQRNSEEHKTMQSAAGKVNGLYSGAAGNSKPEQTKITGTWSSGNSVHVVHDLYSGVAGVSSQKGLSLADISWPQVQNYSNRELFLQGTYFLILQIWILIPLLLKEGGELSYELDLLESLLETKLEAVKIPAAARKIAGTWNWFSNANSSARARILLLWDSNILDVQIENFIDQHITCKVKSIDGRVDCMISSVYGHNNLMNRKDLWSSLNQIHLNIGNKPWLLCGDFNAITSDEEKLGGAALAETDTMDFRDFIEDCQLTHLKTEGCYYTWNNKQDSTSRVWSRLDRALINDCWLNMHNSSHIEYLLPSFSDHSPGLVAIYDECIQGKKSFKFFKMWTKHENYLPTITSVWNTKVTGYAMFSVYSKLKLLKIALKELNKRHFKNISEQVIRSKQALQDAQKNLQVDPLNQSFIDQERKCTVSYNKLLDCELSFYQQKSRILWSLQVSREEIRDAVFSMSENKAPGPDGFSMSFFKTAWGIIGDEVSVAIEDFFKNGKLLGEINSTSINLIPKVQCPKMPSDFRPIACCNCLYKFISKILTNRIKSVMGSLVNEAQSAFVKGRQITSNVLLAHELVKNYSRKHISPRVMLNMDIKKAFDTINWDFLKEMLCGLGFPETMIGWIMACITSPKYSIALNGSLHGYFKGKRGLRQGDPLSPYLFILGMEYLSRSLNMLKDDKKFKFHPRCGKFSITHLIFADDLLLFARGDMYSVNKLQQCFREFSAVSGLEANSNKCSIFFGGVDVSTKTAIINSLGYPEGAMPIRYLGVPLISKRLSCLDCAPLLNKIRDQFQSCANYRHLSYAGRLQLIKSTILGIQVFWTSNYILPAGVLQRIDILCRNFLWGKQDHQVKANSLVAWDKVSLGKKFGGLGIYSASMWNYVSGLKILWNIHIRKESL
ncbi:uncharacterized protein LOC109837465 [Asparagus officinalis]|uniref:uncharacterized protein LOC109837465 n=1 Tax=Asparagus officinalis TaxID=4686 RepID=UPI00098E690B|nr:uncharacterized protein LOC109837465 [Asparagus officinalis]